MILLVLKKNLHKTCQNRHTISRKDKNMNDIKIRDYIINNFKNDDTETIKRAIEESIKEKDEVTLPGMGVFFEIIWQDANDEEKSKILEKLKNRFQQKAN